LVLSASPGASPIKTEEPEKTAILSRIQITVWNRVILLLFIAFLLTQSQGIRDGFFNAAIAGQLLFLGAMTVFLFLQLLHALVAMRQWKDPSAKRSLPDWRKLQWRGKLFMIVVLLCWLVWIAALLLTAYGGGA
jgi:hypothetical protein